MKVSISYFYHRRLINYSAQKKETEGENTCSKYNAFPFKSVEIKKTMFSHFSNTQKSPHESYSSSYLGFIISLVM